MFQLVPWKGQIWGRFIVSCPAFAQDCGSAERREWRGGSEESGCWEDECNDEAVQSQTFGARGSRKGGGETIMS